MNEKGYKVAEAICKIIIYSIITLAAAFGITSLTSCSVNSNVVRETKGKAFVITSLNDTTVINHSGLLEIKKK